MRHPLPAVLLALLAALGLLAGCGSSTDPIDAPIFFEGEVAFQGRNSHEFMIENDGTIRVEMVRLQEKVVEGQEPFGLDLSIGLGIGRPVADDCATRYSVRLGEGGLVLLGLTPADFCIAVFDGGTLFEGLVAEYTVSVSAG